MNVLIRCVLDKKHKLLRVVEGQPGFTVANVSISSTDLDRKAINVDDMFIIDGDKMRWVAGYEYYTYRGPVMSCDETSEAKDGIDITLLTEIKTDSSYVCPTIEDNGFYLKPDLFNLLVRNIKKSINTMLLGATGTGKTQSIQLIAEQLGLPCRIYDMGAMHDPISDLLGVHRLVEGSSVFDYARFVQDVQQPGIIILDELTRAMPTCLNILFPVLDHRRTLPVEIAGCKDLREVKVHPECVFVATANVGIEYTGTATLDKALANRFFPIEFEYMQPQHESKVLQQRCKVDASVSDLIASVATKIRTLNKNAELSSAVSTRETLMTADLVHDGWSLADALKTVMLPLYSGDERNKVLTLLMSK